MGQGGRGGNTFEILVFSPIFLFFPLSLSLLFPPSFFFRRREGGKERMTDHVKGYNGVQG
jgi:hypothetical protein